MFNTSVGEHFRGLKNELCSDYAGFDNPIPESLFRQNKWRLFRLPEVRCDPVKVVGADGIKVSQGSQGVADQ
jgi:hypothetical protein